MLSGFLLWRKAQLEGRGACQLEEIPRG
jgi:hypothetical protein